MPRYGLYLGCVIPTEQVGYELSLREVLPKLGVELVDLEGTSCCGAPLRSINFKIPLYLSARTLAICEKAGMDVLTPCPLCNLALCEAKHVLGENSDQHQKINALLSEEGLEYQGKVKVAHTLEVLHDVVGLKRIKESITRPFQDLTMATHYGCHLIRPLGIDRPDDPEDPRKMDDILEAIGIKTRHYSEKLSCCGAPVEINHPDTAYSKAGQKLLAVQEGGFGGLVDTCPWGHRIMDTKQKQAQDAVGKPLSVPVVYLTQLLGYAMGIDAERLGLKFNMGPIDRLGLIPEQVVVP